jgi:hypothetical protein
MLLSGLSQPTGGVFNPLDGANTQGSKRGQTVS